MEISIGICMEKKSNTVKGGVREFLNIRALKSLNNSENPSEGDVCYI